MMLDVILECVCHIKREGIDQFQSLPRNSLDSDAERLEEKHYFSYQITSDLHF